MSHIVYPLHYLVIQRAGIDWLVKPATWFYKGRNAPADPNRIDYEACYGISRVQLALFCHFPSILNKRIKRKNSER